jgi:hypothetical protein
MSYRFFFGGGGRDPKRWPAEYRSDTTNTGTSRFWAVRSVRADVRDAVNLKKLKKITKQHGAHPLKLNGYITYHQVAHSNPLRSAHTMFRADLRTNSDYFPIQH